MTTPATVDANWAASYAASSEDAEIAVETVVITSIKASTVECRVAFPDAADVDQLIRSSPATSQFPANRYREKRLPKKLPSKIKTKLRHQD